MKLSSRPDGGLRTVLGSVGAVAAVLLCSAVTAQAVGLSQVDDAISAARAGTESSRETATAEPAA
ncbi:MAG TPA: hypothetical protein VJ649_00570, partial [Actinomycetes bacterium]|nr:hypothetical protein [Actinomycetes bacterium]